MTTSSAPRKARKTAAKKPANDDLKAQVAALKAANAEVGAAMREATDAVVDAIAQPTLEHQILAAQAQFLAQAHDAAVSKWIGAKVSNGDIPAADAGAHFAREVGLVNQALQQIMAQAQQGAEANGS